jgi:hypothetical protein
MKSVWRAMNHGGQPRTRDPWPTPAVDLESMYAIRISDERCRERLCDFLRTAHVEVHDEVHDTAASDLHVSVPGALSAHHERREIDGYVRTWNALNPAFPVTLLSPE